MNNIQTLQTLFEQAVQKIDSENIEFWFARDLQTLLGYERWENFKTAINRALEACKHSGQLPSDHFRGRHENGYSRKW
ncbi:DNA-damage-inducible protein D [Avibacterium gallinarum]|uniref:DNA-damage-inducible protein D n=1 Tax=Avibacterium gallinarum TaxID=755 RepID=A0A379ATY1_AVIGA|nr:BRO family protein [Avibacterium gallinarum]SUB25688.1 DNA-damage-inducible protein D [Avibacterium gallinarum]